MTQSRLPDRLKRNSTLFDTPLCCRNVTHDSDFQEIRQVEATTRFKEPSIMDEDNIGSFSRRKDDADDLSDLMGSKKVWNSREQASRE